MRSKASAARRRSWGVALGATTGALLLAACGSTTTTSSAPVGTSTHKAKTAAPAAVVGAASVSSFGKVLVDPTNGETLYILSSEKGGKFTCTGKCTSIWPPLTVPSGTTKVSGKGVSGKLAIIKAPGGKRQVTDNGYPLYRFSGDTAKGQAKGEGIKAFGGTWSVASASATTASSTPVLASSSSSSYGSSSSSSTKSGGWG